MAPWGDGTMIVTTTPSVEGMIHHHLSTVVVVGEAILGANVFRDVFDRDHRYHRRPFGRL